MSRRRKKSRSSPSEDASPKEVEGSPATESQAVEQPSVPPSPPNSPYTARGMQLKSKPVIQDFQCPETKESSLDKGCKAGDATLRVERGSSLSSFKCECGMPFRAKVA